MQDSRQGYNVFISERPESLGYDVYIYIRQGEDILFAQIKDGRLEFKKSERKYIEGKPTFYLDYRITQQLSEALNRAHIQPKEESITKGKLIATEKHLEDMRKIVFKKLSIN